MDTVLELRCPPLPFVRIGLIGLGRRGMKTLERYAFIKDAAIRCLADIDPTRLDAANESLERSGRPRADLHQGPEAWREVCHRADIDLIYICTDWATHCDMAVEAMRHGKHVAVEGLLGEITHCEGAYIHNLRDTFGLTGNTDNTAGNWMEKSCARHKGNPYPTHGIGPIGWLLGLHRGDRMDYLVSLTSRGCGPDHLLGRVNSTLIRTVKGASILLQLDVTTMRPYSRLQTVCGTKGYVQKYPVPTIKNLTGNTILTGEEALAEARLHTQMHAARLWQEGHRKNVPNEMNYTMDARLIHCLRHGLPLDIDVYDAAEWSCIAELSERSAREGSRPISIPDFTHGHWHDLTAYTMYSA